MFRYNDAGNGDILINRIDVHATNSTTIFAPLSWYGFPGYAGTNISCVKVMTLTTAA